MKIAIIGRTEILYNTAIYLRENGHEIVCMLTSKEAPEYKRTANDFKNLADSWKIPFENSSKIENFSNMLINSEAEIGISMNYTGILSQQIIDIFKYGVLNAHGGDLPKYRGNACQAWAILNGEEKIGLCIHKMIGGEIDSGNIIARDYLKIDQNTKVTSVWKWMAFKTPNLFLKSIYNLLINPDYFLEKQSKKNNDVLRCYPRKPEDCRIIWSQPAIDILRLINASNKPYIGAYCYLQEIKIIIWDAELIDDKEIFLAVPGQITKINENFFEVACGEGKLKIKEIEYENEKAASISRFIKSTRQRLI